MIELAFGMVSLLLILVGAVLWFLAWIRAFGPFSEPIIGQSLVISGLFFVMIDALGVI